MIARRLGKTRQALTTPRRDLDNEDADAAANRTYYALVSSTVAWRGDDMSGGCPGAIRGRR